MAAYVQTIPTCGLGESPHWNASKNELIYIDASGQNIHRYVPETGQRTQVHIEGGIVTFAVPVEGQDKYVVGVNRSIQMVEWDGMSSEPSSVKEMFALDPNIPLNHLNDGKCDTSGRLWTGTRNELVLPVANIYRVTPTSMQNMHGGISFSNGFGWNSDETLMYHNDTATRQVHVYDFDKDEGTISNQRTIFNFNLVGERGFPDGLTVDANGNVWIACFSGTQIIQLDPNTGQKTRAIEMPTKVITSMTFGGPNLDVMYVTSGTDYLTDAEKREQPSAGSLFQITNLGARGTGPGNSFRM